MTLGDLDPVVLDIDIPEYSLPKRSLVTLKSSQLRKPTDDDLLCVNRLAAGHHVTRAAKHHRPRRPR
jgi:hypothetical protein